MVFLFPIQILYFFWAFIQHGNSGKGVHCWRGIELPLHPRLSPPFSLLPWAAFLHRWNWSLSVGDAKRLWVWLNIFICDLDDGIKGGLS